MATQPPLQCPDLSLPFILLAIHGYLVRYTRCLFDYTLRRAALLLLFENDECAPEKESALFRVDWGMANLLGDGMPS